jgi:hypothetical protein
MEMTRTSRMLAAAALALALLAGSPSAASASAASASPPGAMDTVLVLRASGPKFDEAVKGLRNELGEGFACVETKLEAGFGAAQLAELVGRSRPKAMVLMDNAAIGLYGEVQAAWRDSVAYPPAVAMMAVRVDKAIAQLKRTTGIFYEVPGVTTLVNLRSLVRDSVRKVGVILRPGMEDFVRENARWCLSENIRLVPYVVGEDRKDLAGAVRDGVRRLWRKEGVDALWILNDNYFLTPGIIADGWLPALQRFEKPVLVGVENFVSGKVKFGTFAVLPDEYGLGAQAAGILHQSQEDGWAVTEAPQLEQPLAIYKLLNLRQARKYSHLDELRLREIDKVVE